MYRRLLLPPWAQGLTPTLIWSGYIPISVHKKHRSYKHSVTHLHKGPLLPSWVRDFQATFLDFKALIEDNVQIKRPRAPPLPMQIPAQLSLPHRENSELSTSYGVIH